MEYNTYLIYYNILLYTEQWVKSLLIHSTYNRCVACDMLISKIES